MSRDSPSLDELYGAGAEDADDFAGQLDELRSQFETKHRMYEGDLDEAMKVYERELTRMWEENLKLESQLVSAGEEIEHLRASQVERDDHA